MGPKPCRDSKWVVFHEILTRTIVGKVTSHAMFGLTFPVLARYYAY